MDTLTHLRDLAVNDRGFVFDPHTGDTFTTNPTGLAILRDLQEGTARAAILDHLAATFDVDGGDPERDLDDFVATLRRLGLVPADFEP
jgi:PqqD family protein of HPr-rel-A system